MRVILAGGGTGGHLFPAVALAKEFKERDGEVLFIGGRRGLEERVLPGYGFLLELLDVEGLKGRGIFGKVKACLKALMAIFTSTKMVKRFRPDIVVGTGGYSSGPVVLGAKLLGVKTAILEPNAIPGFTNRWLGRFVDRVFLAFDKALGYFPSGKALLTGNPVRREIIEAGVREDLKPPEGFTILVFGGSQGAKAINSLFLGAMEYLTSVPSALSIIHQTGEDDYERVREAYGRLRITNYKLQITRFIDDMAGAYKKADLVICRAGATSIAEIITLGMVSILIPYPFAADNHQEINARCLADNGAAIMMREGDVNGETLAGIIRRFIEDPDELERMRERAKTLGRPGATEAVVEECYKLVASNYVQGSH